MKVKFVKDIKIENQEILDDFHPCAGKLHRNFTCNVVLLSPTTSNTHLIC
jgi:hypothetical protein